MSARTIDGIDELRGLVGETLGQSDWLQIDQERIDAFADATDDHQWIHVDPERAAETPFGSTIAHGYLTLSLVPRLSSEAYTVTGLSSVINYGGERLRFPAPVPVGSRIRATVELVSVEDVKGGAQAHTRVTIEREGGDRPVLVAETLSRLMA